MVRVRSPQSDSLARLLVGQSITVRNVADHVLEVEGRSSEEIGTTAAENGITLFELTAQSASLEDAYMALTADSVDFRSPASTDADPDHIDPEDAAA